ncbi:MAG: sugar phosphate nucleotidyltransferase [Candidatus Aenigmatarchaeota archaeon]
MIVMPECISLTPAGGAGTRIKALTTDRLKPSVPFGGIYRIIDFALNNLYNSGLKDHNYFLVQAKAKSLNDHFDEWKIQRHFHIHSIAPGQTEMEWYKGSADAIRLNMDIVRNEKPDYVVILSGDHVYKMDYRPFIRYHIENHKRNGTALTISTIEVPKERAKDFGIIDVDGPMVTGFREKPREMPKEESVLASMGIYIFDAKVLMDVFSDGGIDIGRNIVPNMLGLHKISAYNYTKENKIIEELYEMRDGMRNVVVAESPDSGYWMDVGKVHSYYKASMDLVGATPKFNLYGKRWPFWSVYSGNLPPAKLSDGSLVSPGCILGGNTVVSKSIISPMVIMQDARISDSILGERVQVGPGCDIRRAIIDKDVRIPPGTIIGHDYREDLRRGFDVGDEKPDYIAIVGKGFEF